MFRPRSRPKGDAGKGRGMGNAMFESESTEVLRDRGEDPPANVEIVRRVMDAHARRDWDTVFALYDPDIEWDQSRNPYAIDLPTTGRGHDAVRAWFRRMGEAWELYSYEDEGMAEAEDHVVQFIRWRARGRT